MRTKYQSEEEGHGVSCDVPAGSGAGVPCSIPRKHNINRVVVRPVLRDGGGERNACGVCLCAYEQRERGFVVAVVVREATSRAWCWIHSLPQLPPTAVLVFGS